MISRAKESRIQAIEEFGISPFGLTLTCAQRVSYPCRTMCIRSNMCIRSKLSNNLLHWLFACLLPCGIWANTRWVSAQEVFDGPGVILLKNDRFQAGIVHRFADAVQVELDARSKVTHSASDVEYIGKDL